MNDIPSGRFEASLLAALGTVAGAAAPLVAPAPAAAQKSFADVASDYWARPYIQAMAERGIISGFPNGTFRPDEPVTRAQFAAMLNQAFSKSTAREPIAFQDVPQDHWASEAIRQVYATGFLTGYPNQTFQPAQNIPRVQVLASLAGGLNYEASQSPDATLDYYNDASAIPDWARSSVAAATQNQIVVNHPNVRQLQPERQATRAEVAASIHQALVSAGRASAIESQYVVRQQGTAKVVPAQTSISAQYDKTQKVYLSPQEPNPVPVTLKVAQAVTDEAGQVLIPKGTPVEGELRIARSGGQQGARFFAERLRLSDDRAVALDATSGLITQTKVVKGGTDVEALLKGAAVGAGAQAAIEAVTGDRQVDAGAVLGNTTAEVLAGVFSGQDQAELFVLDSSQELSLTLNAQLKLN